MKNINDKTKILKKLGSVVGMSVMLVAPIAIVTTNLNNDQVTNITATSQTPVVGDDAVKVGDSFEVLIDEDSGYLKYTVLTVATQTSKGIVSVEAGSRIKPEGIVHIPSSVIYNWGTYAVTEIGAYAFTDCIYLTVVDIPETVVSIGNHAFAGCISLTNVNIPRWVSVIEDSTFFGCWKLTDVVIPNGVTSIGDEAFWGCISLTDVIIPDSVTSIGGGAFSDCKKLYRVTIGAGIESIGYCVFRNCDVLASISIYASTPPELADYLISPPMESELTIYVPGNSVEAYKNASTWTRYKDIITELA